MLEKYEAKSGFNHWKVLKHVVRYIKCTFEFGILITSLDETVGLEAWSDADWERDLSKRHSRSGYLVKYEPATLIWSSKLQTDTAMFTTEEEFAALSSWIREVVWIPKFISELDFQIKSLITVYQDNFRTI